MKNDSNAKNEIERELEEKPEPKDYKPLPSSDNDGMSE